MSKQSMLIIGGFVILALGVLAGYTTKSTTQSAQVEWKQVTVIESVVAAGLGRSRMISTDSDGKIVEEKIKNLFSATGINFGNVKENDLRITDQITTLANEGWELYDVNTGVAMYGRDNSDGIFMTRYLFRKPL